MVGNNDGVDDDDDNDGGCAQVEVVWWLTLDAAKALNLKLGDGRPVFGWGVRVCVWAPRPLRPEFRFDVKRSPPHTFSHSLNAIAVAVAFYY